MCGIFFSCSQRGHALSADHLKVDLSRRGPDSICTAERAIGAGSASPKTYLTFVSTVLSLRSDAVTRQPLEDPNSDSLLCWNGEAWKIGSDVINSNDAQVVFDLLMKASLSFEPGHGAAVSSGRENTQNILNGIASIAGPYAFVFYDALHQRVFFGRDALGRRSLTARNELPERFTISSICDLTDTGTWTEVEADGIYLLDLQGLTSSRQSDVQPITLIPRLCQDLTTELQLTTTSRYPIFNSSNRASVSSPLTLESSAVEDISHKLRESMLLRVDNVPIPSSSIPNSARVAVLFSGGLDCTILARLSHDILPKEQAIDLLNVAFENPRVIQAAAKGGLRGEVDPYGLCPDRITGLNSHAELQHKCPERTWRFVAIDVSYMELQDHRSKIIDLIYPHDTEMDFSIACALYFAARGKGTTVDPDSDSTTMYQTPARVLLSGLGADELFGGYTRHSTAFNRREYAGLVDELQLDFSRLGKRNLGRDDRVISHWGKEVRYPYLDDDLVSWVLSIPVWDKCGFGHLDTEKGASSPMLEPSKKLLRLLAWKLGMPGAAAKKKRAIQFGARTAKMEAGKTKGNQVLC